MAEKEPTQVVSVAEKAARCSNPAVAARVAGQGSLRPGECEGSVTTPASHRNGTQPLVTELAPWQKP